MAAASPSKPSNQNRVNPQGLYWCRFNTVKHSYRWKDHVILHILHYSNVHWWNVTKYSYSSILYFTLLFQYLCTFCCFILSLHCNRYSTFTPNFVDLTSLVTSYSAEYFYFYILKREILHFLLHHMYSVTWVTSYFADACTSTQFQREFLYFFFFFFYSTIFNWYLVTGYFAYYIYIYSISEGTVVLPTALLCFDSSSYFPGFINKEYDALHVFGNFSYYLHCRVQTFLLHYERK